MLIQNFIKQGNLGPLTEDKLSSRNESDIKQTDGTLEFDKNSKQVLSNIDRSSLLKDSDDSKEREVNASQARFACHS